MSDPPPRPRSPLWMVILALVCEEPMHPYRMQTLIKQRGKDQIANVAQRNSVYQTIVALLRAGLISVRETSRPDRHPERTVYEATEIGRRALRSWVRTGLSTPAREFPEFPAVLSLLYGVRGPDDMRALFETRIAAFEPRLKELEKSWPGLPRIFLVESEYAAAMMRAEIRWLRAIVSDLESGKLAFPSEEEIRKIGAEMGGPSDGGGRGDDVAPTKVQRASGQELARRKTKAAASARRRPDPGRARRTK